MAALARIPAPNPIELSVNEARIRFLQLVRQPRATRQTVVIIDRGQPVAAIVSPGMAAASARKPPAGTPAPRDGCNGWRRSGTTCDANTTPTPQSFCRRSTGHGTSSTPSGHPALTGTSTLCAPPSTATTSRVRTTRPAPAVLGESGAQPAHTVGDGLPARLRPRRPGGGTGRGVH